MKEQVFGLRDEVKAANARTAEAEKKAAEKDGTIRQVCTSQALSALFHKYCLRTHTHSEGQTLGRILGSNVKTQCW